MSEKPYCPAHSGFKQHLETHDTQIGTLFEKVDRHTVLLVATLVAAVGGCLGVIATLITIIAQG